MITMIIGKSFGPNIDSLVLSVEEFNQKEIPYGLTEKDLDLFVRILKASNTSELQDVTLEDTLNLFEKSEALYRLISRNNVMTDGSLDRTIVSDEFRSICTRRTRRML